MLWQSEPAATAAVPELPEVETVRRGLERQVVGFTIARVEVLRARAIAAPPLPELFCRALESCTVTAWLRRGKYLMAAQPGRDRAALEGTAEQPVSYTHLTLPTKA